MNKNMRYKLREDKQDEFIKNYEYQSYKYANRDDCYYLKISKHLILDQDTLEILAPTNKLEEEDIDLLAKLEANNMLEFYKEVSEWNIQEFADTIIQLQQENEQLKEEKRKVRDYINKHCVNEKISKEVGYKCYTMADTNELEKIMKILGDDK